MTSNKIRERLIQLFQANGRQSRRALSRRFSDADREHVQFVIDELISKGVLTRSGAGRSRSPEVLVLAGTLTIEACPYCHHLLPKV